MTYQALHELELKYKLDSLLRDAEQRSRTVPGTEQEFARHRIRQIQAFAGVIVFYMIVLAAASVAIVLHEIGPWVLAALAVWAVTLAYRATSILAPDVRPVPVPI